MVATYAEQLREVLCTETPNYQRTEAGRNVELDLSFGEAKFAWPEGILEAMVTPIDSLLRYQSPHGALGLRTAVAAGARDFNDRIDVDNILITSGAKQALGLVFQTKVRPGDRVLLPRPGWGPYVIWTRMAGAEPRWYDPQDPEAQGLLHEIAAGNAEHVVVNSPHNPTGTEYRQEVIDAIARAALASGMCVISDEVYRCFATYGGSFLAHVSERANVVVVDSISKALGAAGLRVGFLVADPATISDATMLRGLADSCPPGLSQASAIFLLSAAAAPFRQRVRALARTTVHSLAQQLTAAGIPVKSSGAMYVWVGDVAADGCVPLAGRVLRGSPGATFGVTGYTRLCPVTDDTWLAELISTKLAVAGLEK